MDNPFAKLKEKEEELIIEGSGKEIEESIEASEEIKVEEIKEVKPRMTKAQQILAQHGGLTSNIPINSPYWKLRHARKK